MGYCQQLRYSFYFLFYAQGQCFPFSIYQNNYQISMPYQKLFLVEELLLHHTFLTFRWKYHPNNVQLFIDQMMDTISSSEKEIFSILLLILYSNGGNVLSLLIGVH